jgi:hypothetical protein
VLLLLSLVLFSRNEAVTARARGIKTTTRRRQSPPRPGTTGPHFIIIFFTTTTAILRPYFQWTSRPCCIGLITPRISVSSANLAGGDVDECCIQHIGHYYLMRVAAIFGRIDADETSIHVSPEPRPTRTRA